MQLRRKSNALDCCAAQARRSRKENKLAEKYQSAMGKKKLRFFSIKRDLFSSIRDVLFSLSPYSLRFFSCCLQTTRIFVLFVRINIDICCMSSTQI